MILDKMFVFCTIITIFFSSNNSFAFESYENDGAMIIPENLNQMYHSDYKNFWLVFNEASRKSVSCDNILYTAEFLKISKFVNNNAEFKEAFMESIETNLLTNNIECFLDALLIIDTAYVDIILDDLKHPLFAEEYVVRDKLREMYLNEKYTIILQPFFDK